jgi:hypothetical protein
VAAVVLIPHGMKATAESVIRPHESHTNIHDLSNKLGGQWKEVSTTACFADWKGRDLDVIVTYERGLVVRGRLPRNLK